MHVPYAARAKTQPELLPPAVEPREGDETHLLHQFFALFTFLFKQAQAAVYSLY